MATFKSRVHTVGTRSSRLNFADLETGTKNRKRSSRTRHELYLVVELGEVRAVMSRSVSRLLLKRTHYIQTPELNGLSEERTHQ